PLGRLAECFMTQIWTTRNFSASNVWESIACSRVGQKRVCLTMKFCVEVLSALTRSTHFYNDGEGHFVTANSSRDIARDESSDLSRSLPVLVETRLCFLWRTDRPDRHDAQGGCREKEVDQRNAFSPRAEFLHAAARAGSTATRYLYRLAFTQDAGRHRRGRPLCYSINLHSLGAELHLCRLRSRSVDCRDLLRTETGRARDCRRSRDSHWQQSAQERCHVGNRHGGVRSDLFFPRAISIDHHQRRDHRARWREDSTAIF